MKTVHFYRHFKHPEGQNATQKSNIFSYLKSILKLTPDSRLRMEALDEGMDPEFHGSLQQS